MSRKLSASRVGWVLATSVALAVVPSLTRAGGLVGVRAAHGANVAAATSVIATSARLASSADKAELSFDLTAAVAADAYVLADPDRVIVDLPEVDFRAAPQADKPGRHRRGAAPGLVASYRFGLVAPGRSRIVVDLAAPARASATVVTTGGRQRLVVTLARTDAASFRAAAIAHAVTAAVAVAPPPPLPTRAPDLATIVIDAGHGGPDTGAMVDGVVEKDVTLAFAKALAAKLRTHGGFNVVMTRPDDVFVPLAGRVQIARESKAALMVSIHADTLPESADVSGATVYTVSDRASDAYAAKVAAKENAADATAGGEGQADRADVNDILFDLTRQETRAYSHVFARTLVDYWKAVGRLNKNPRRSAGFVVLKAPDVPSILLELGYLSSKADAASLTSDAWRETASSRMAAAIEAYFADRAGPAKAAAGVPMPLPSRQAQVER